MADKFIATNREARYKFTLFDVYEAGIELKGSEVKSLRAGRASIKDSFARIEKGEVMLYNMHIPPYEFASIAPPEPTRPRKLLLKKSEIRKLLAQTQQKGYTVIPTKMYFKRGYAKIEIALAKGKKLYDKRQVTKERETQRELRRSLRNK